MEFKNLVELEKYFENYLNYKGYNLWTLSETGMYENFVKFPKKKSFLKKKKDLLSRYFVNEKNREKEKQITEKIGEGKEILILLYGISPINTFKPIIKKIDDKIKVVRYDPPSSEITKEFLMKKNITYTNIDNYITKQIKKELKRSEKWLNKIWNKLKKDAELKKLLGKDYFPILQGLEYFCKTRKVYLEIIRLIELYERMFDLEKPKVLIVSDDANAYGRSAVFVAKKKNIKTISIQHGQLQGNVVVSNSAEKIIVNGYKDKEYLISQGVYKNKIVVAGQIRFDEISEKIKLDRKEICNKYKLNPHKKIIVYSYQTPISGENIIENARNCFLKNLDKIDKTKYEVVITMRPDTPKDIFLRKGIKLLPGANIQELAVCSEILITAFSTAAVEYVLMGKPVVTINIGAEKGEYIDYSDLGVGFTIYNEKDFIPALITCLEDKEFKKKFKQAKEKFIEDYNYKMDGRALERILNEINNEIKWKE